MTRTENILKTLASMGYVADDPSTVELIERLITDAWLDDEVVAMCKLTEECNPELREETALRKMREVAVRVSQRLGRVTCMGGVIYVETQPCMLCGSSATLLVNAKDCADWMQGKHIQQAMPYLSKEDRERLISGTCPECWKKL